MAEIRQSDLRIERLRRTGPGGQRRNRKETGVRVTHVPTGVTVMATERRSQQMNLEIALERLGQRLARLAARPKPRKRTRPSRAVKEQRLQGKKVHSTKKKLRGPVSWSD